ncbi:hypothetical protein Salat_2421300 [Sesamum alatum]|uniref:Uncharacterized protein n=1 Tax=Sesamum alatum TaxID=300844 RepID=A0AAE1XY23_9LAMI|nr:hypothetical protein Salat_2421300 [Sesamum alatum]
MPLNEGELPLAAIARKRHEKTPASWVPPTTMLASFKGLDLVATSLLKGMGHVRTMGSFSPTLIVGKPIHKSNPEAQNKRSSHAGLDDKANLKTQAMIQPKDGLTQRNQPQACQVMGLLLLVATLNIIGTAELSTTLGN